MEQQGLTVGEQLKKFLRGEGISQENAAKMIGISRPTLSEYMNRAVFPEDALQNVKRAWPAFNIADTPASFPTTEGNISGTITHNPLISRVRQGGGEVPYYDADFVAGNPINFFEDNVDRPAYTMSIPGYAGCIAFPAYGDSMETMIRSGSVLFGRKLEDWRSYLEFGQIYGIVMKDERRFLKYIRKAEDDRNKFLLRSENDRYDDFEVPKNKIHNIWLIEGWMVKKA